MMAREEIAFKPRPKLRSKSLPGPSDATTSATTASTSGRFGHAPAVPTRYASIGPDVPQRASIYATADRDDPSEAFSNFKFPAPTGEPSTPRRPRSNSKSLDRPSSVSLSPKARVDRKQYPEATQLEPTVPPLGLDCQSEPVQDRRSCIAGSVTREFRYLDPSTWPKPKPGGSRRHTLLVAIPNEPNRNNANLSRRPLSLAIHTPATRRSVKSLRRSTSMSGLARRKSLVPALKEPTVDDFLALSDDDIADGANNRARTPACHPPSSALSPHSSPFRAPVWTGPDHPMLTLSPPLAARPAAQAAIEAARIAAKYRLDLLYVVNLWPSHMSRPSRSSPFDGAFGSRVALSPHDLSFGTTPSPPESPMSSGYDSSGGCESPRRGTGLAMTGRLLAAYGLDSVQYPFRISAPANLKALRANDWLEFRNDKAARNEYAVGYSRAFYTGHSPARAGNGAATSTSHLTTSEDRVNKGFWPPPNRGIVFSAFRVADERGNLILSDQAELREMYREVEGLVNMLIDLHKGQRRTRTPKGTPRRRCVNSPGGRVAMSSAPTMT
ncbi:hypothetical protein VTJ49DRAFT_750 [Mycothermus thermophilus]|uniref:Uncharacterized protein n=1 Tax=Humicola insolens TaxID=85995 RepID=A0ABR3VFH7_HUMIN